MPHGPPLPPDSPLTTHPPSRRSSSHKKRTPHKLSNLLTTTAADDSGSEADVPVPEATRGLIDFALSSTTPGKEGRKGRKPLAERTNELLPSSTVFGPSPSPSSSNRRVPETPKAPYPAPHPSLAPPSRPATRVFRPSPPRPTNPFVLVQQQRERTKAGVGFPYARDEGEGEGERVQVGVRVVGEDADVEKAEPERGRRGGGKRPFLLPLSRMHPSSNSNAASPPPSPPRSLPLTSTRLPHHPPPPYHPSSNSHPAHPQRRPPTPHPSVLSSTYSSARRSSALVLHAARQSTCLPITSSDGAGGPRGFWGVVMAVVGSYFVGGESSARRGHRRLRSLMGPAAPAVVPSEQPVPKPILSTLIGWAVGLVFRPHSSSDKADIENPPPAPPPSSSGDGDDDSGSVPSSDAASSSSGSDSSALPTPTESAGDRPPPYPGIAAGTVKGAVGSRGGGVVGRTLGWVFGRRSLAGQGVPEAV